MKKCLKCGYEWNSRIEHPKRCPWCGQAKWWEPRQDGVVPETHCGVPSPEVGIAQAKALAEFAQSGVTVKIEGKGAERKIEVVPDLPEQDFSAGVRGKYAGKIGKTVVVEPAEVEGRKKLAAGIAPEKKPVEAETETKWFPHSKCPHGYQNSLKCHEAGGGC